MVRSLPGIRFPSRTQWYIPRRILRVSYPNRLRNRGRWIHRFSILRQLLLKFFGKFHSLNPRWNRFVPLLRGYRLLVCRGPAWRCVCRFPIPRNFRWLVTVGGHLPRMCGVVEWAGNRKPFGCCGLHVPAVDAVRLIRSFVHRWWLSYWCLAYLFPTR